MTLSRKFHARTQDALRALCQSVAKQAEDVGMDADSISRKIGAPPPSVTSVLTGNSFSLGLILYCAEAVGLDVVAVPHDGA